MLAVQRAITDSRALQPWPSLLRLSLKSISSEIRPIRYISAVVPSTTSLVNGSFYPNDKEPTAVHRTRDVLRTLELLYGTLDDPDLWRPFVSECCDLLECDGGNVVFIDAHRPELSTVIQNYSSDAMIATYIEHFLDQDWQAKMLEAMPTGEVHHLGMYPQAVRDSYYDSRYFQEYARHTPMWMSLGGVFQKDEGGLGRTGFHRRDPDRAFGPDDVACLELLHGHIQTVLKQGASTALLEDVVSALGGGRDGVLLLDRAGRLLHANMFGEQILRDGAGLMLRNHTVCAENSRDNARLCEAIAAAASETAEVVAKPLVPRQLTVARHSNPVPLIVSVMHNRRRAPFPQSPTSRVAVILTVIDRTREPELNENVLRDLFALTPREIDLATSLLAGLGLREASDRLSMSYETARSYVKSMNAKMGVRSQAQLVGLLLRLQTPAE